MRPVSLFCGASGIVAAALVACSVGIKTGPGVPIVGGSEFTGEVDPSTGEIGIPPQPGIPAGTCIKLTFYGPGGTVLGSTTVSAGGSPANAPPGTEEVGASQCDPPEEPPKPKKFKRSRSSSASNLVVEPVQRFGFRILPFDFSDGRARYADYWSLGGTFAQAEDLSRRFVASFTSEPCPLGIEPNAVVDCELLADNRVRVSMFSVEPPRSLRFDWNGSFLFDLDGALVTAENGWYRTTVIVPSSLVETSVVGVSENSFDYRLGVSDGDLGTRIELAVTP